MNKLDNLQIFVKQWLESQEDKKFFEPDKNGNVMFKRGALSINLPSYLEMILEDYLEEHAANKEKVYTQEDMDKARSEEWWKGWSAYRESL